LIGTQVLERARKAESEAAALKAQLKSETSTAKKTLRELETALTESTALSQRSEREYITLRESIKGMVEGWKTDTENLREEMRKREERWRKEAEMVGQKYRKLVEEVKAVQDERGTVEALRAEDHKTTKELEDAFREELDRLKAEVARTDEATGTACETAR
jgi:predicted  nucleic acid-binding Zn-ribbon protein